MSTQVTPDELARQATAWAATVLTRKGCTLHPTATGWDVEMPDGSWNACNTRQELVDAAISFTLKRDGA
jgi:hypothetical protein